MKTKLLALVGVSFVFGISVFNTPSQVKPYDFSWLNPERSGCCSHHGGVCGCDASGKRAACCDGTISPSCGC